MFVSDAPLPFLPGGSTGIGGVGMLAFAARRRALAVPGVPAPSGCGESGGVAMVPGPPGPGVPAEETVLDLRDGSFGRASGSGKIGLVTTGLAVTGDGSSLPGLALAFGRDRRDPSPSSCVARGVGSGPSTSSTIALGRLSRFCCGFGVPTYGPAYGSLVRRLPARVRSLARVGSSTRPPVCGPRPRAPRPAREFGWKKMPAGWPSGLCMTTPVDGDVPSRAAASAKYSMPSDMLSGLGSGSVGALFSTGSSFGLRAERSELVREADAGTARW
jgi:hypothetical protein